MVVVTNVAVSRNMTPCKPVDMHRRFWRISASISSIEERGNRLFQNVVGYLPNYKA